jgi:hypothetical protein
VVLHLVAMPAGTATALALALGVSIGWNLLILGLRRRGGATRQHTIGISGRKQI